jgi:hypothetical protein
VYVSEGKLVLDGVAISGTSAVVRALGLAHDGRMVQWEPAAE